jgi:two-component system chemotaxis sensor kinase CheA
VSETDELVREFLIESHDNLDRLDRELVELEQTPDSAEALASIFRTIHTIKGTCGFLGFARLEAVAHAAESLLSRVRDGELRLDGERTTGLLQAVDAIRAMLALIERAGVDGDDDHAGLVASLHRLQDPTVGSTPAPSSEGSRLQAPGSRSEAEPERPESPAGRAGTSPVRSGLEPGAWSPEPSLPAAPPAGDGQQGEHRHTVSEAYVRVDVGLLDKLMNMVGELVLARNQILQFQQRVDDQMFTATTQRLNLITTELQSGVMKTRLQPIGNIWDKLPRLVRDLSRSLGKQIRLEMEGKETELDKTIIETIKDPLTHIVRNSLDHGIETPAERVAKGKPAEGRLFLRAFHEGGQVNIEISDDGAGLRLDRIRAKALERGVITPEQAARLSDRDVAELIFLPGFSTAEKVSNVSGRGVGMDVVKTNIERVGGIVDLQSRPGQGTTFRIKIPLTLAIIPALVVSSAGDRYAIPQISLLELVRLKGAQVRAGIDSVHGTPVCRLRGNLLPLVDLNRELGTGPARALGDLESINIVVLQADDRKFGLIVDGISDTEEIVVKPLGKHCKGIAAFAGATIMGDGRVALILDVLGLAQQAAVIGEERHRARRAEAAHDTANDRSAVLLFSLSDGRPMAVPLSMLARLEVFDAKMVERLAGSGVVQYRGEVMPLVDIEQVLGGAGSSYPAPGERVHVLVHNTGRRHVGLMVGRIRDIVAETLQLQRSGVEHTAPGVLGCAVIQQTVTEVLDLGVLLQAAAPMVAGGEA